MKNNFLLLSFFLVLALLACNNDDDDDNGPNDNQSNHITIGDTEYGINDIFLSNELTSHEDQYFIGFTDGEFLEDGSAVEASFISAFVINSESSEDLATGVYRIQDNNLAYTLTTVENEQAVTRNASSGTLDLTHNQGGNYTLEFDLTLDNEEHITGFYHGPITTKTIVVEEEEEEEETPQP